MSAAQQRDTTTKIDMNIDEALIAADEFLPLLLGDLDDRQLADTMVRGYQPGEVVEAALGHAFYLARAPLSPDVITAIRKAANHGMSRWQ